MKLLITGASGYIGSRLVQLAQDHSYEVVVASRKPILGISLWLPFDLNNASKIDLPEDIDAVLHLAADTADNSDDGNNEVIAAKMLIVVATKVGAKFLFVSSQTARADAPTNYGRTKWRIEQEVLAAKGIVVRPGQVYGGFERGLFGTLVRLVRTLPVLPAFVPPPFVQPIHVDDCALGLLRLIECADIPSKVHYLASANVVSFTDFLRLIAKHRLRSHKVYLPVPVFLVYIFLKLLGVKLSAQFGLNRMNSLFNLPSMVTAPSLKAIKLKLRTLESGMHRSGSNRRRMLVKEAITILTYILRNKPKASLVRRYVRMVEKLREGVTLALPSWLLIWPTALALLDDRVFAGSALGKEFEWRIDSATVIAEASVQGASRFLGSNKTRQPLTAALQIFITLIKVIFWRLLRIIFFPLLSRIHNGSNR